MTAQAPSLPKSKRDRIVYLLDHWDEIHHPPMSSSNGGRGGGGHTALLPRMAGDRSVRELERCLALVKEKHPIEHSHLMAYHCAEWRIHTRLGSVKRKGGRRERVELRDRHRCVPGWVAVGYVRAAEFRLVELYVGVVDIPDELWDALTLSSEEANAKAERRRARHQTAVPGAV